MPVHDDLPCGNLLLVLLWRQRGQEFLLRRIGKHQTRAQFGVAQRNQLREQGTPAMPGQDAAPPGGPGHRSQITDLGSQRQRRRRITGANASPVLGHHPGPWCHKRHDPCPGQRTRFAKGRVKHHRRMA